MVGWGAVVIGSGLPLLPLEDLPLASARLAFKEKVCVSVAQGGWRVWGGWWRDFRRKEVHFFGHKLNFLGEPREGPPRRLWKNAGAILYEAVLI